MLFSAQQIATRVAGIAAELRPQLQPENTVALVVLRGAVPFAVDLMRALAVDLPVEYAWASSYRSGTERGRLRIAMTGSTEVRGLDVLIIEDIVDTGHTLLALREQLLAAGASQVHTIALLDKPARREVDIVPDLAGFTIGANDFVIGYGLDFNGRYRNLPFIAIPDEASELQSR